MTLRRWDIVFLRTDANDPTGHPGVVLSSEDILTDPRQLRINVVMGTKRPPGAENRPHHVLLNGADGLDFQTQINCALVHVARKESVLRFAGTVTLERRREISRKIRAFLGLG